MDLLLIHSGCFFSFLFNSSTLPNRRNIFGRSDDFFLLFHCARCSCDYLLGLTKTSLTDVQIKPICDYFEVDENTIFGIRNLINNNKEYSEYFFKILFSYDFKILLHNIYLSLLTRKRAASELLKILHDKEKELNNDEKSLYDEYGEEGVAYSSHFDTFMDKLYFNEYKMQKSLFELVNGMCKECTVSDLIENSDSTIIPSTKTLEELNCYIDTISDCINQKIFYNNHSCTGHQLLFSYKMILSFQYSRHHPI